MTIPHRVPKAREVTPLLRNDPQMWVLAKAVGHVMEVGEDEVLSDVSEMVDRGSWESAYFWAVAIDAARGMRRVASPERVVPDLDKVIEYMVGTLAAYRKAMK